MLKNKNGYSLVEIMIVVSIIGILSAIAIPRFQSFQRRAKQSEAKTMLSALYSAQKVFRTEHDSYYSNLLVVGLEPEGSLRYTIGFGTVTSASLPGFTTAPYTHGHNRNTHHLCGDAFDTDIGSNCKYESGVPIYPVISDTFCTNNEFVAMARALQSVLGGSALEDRWTINQKKEIVNVINGAI